MAYLNICDDWSDERKIDAFLSHHSDGRRILKSAVTVAAVCSPSSVKEASFKGVSGMSYMRIFDDAKRCGLAKRLTQSGFELTELGWNLACRMAS